MAPGDQSIMDEVPPYSWRGPDALGAFLVDAGKDAQRMQDTDSHTTLGPPRVVNIEGDNAYAVFPYHFSYKRAGVPMSEDAILAFAAQRSPAGWQIVSMAFSAGAPDADGKAKETVRQP
jgi:hypothetical protein